jgi:hypothetical protein
MAIKKNSKRGKLSNWETKRTSPALKFREHFVAIKRKWIPITIISNKKVVTSPRG